MATQSPIKRAAKAAFPYSAPMISGFLFLGISYGMYMKSMGFSVWYPLAMAALIYSGTVEFIVAAALVTPFSPISLLFICFMVSGRLIFYGISILEKYGANLGKKRLYLIAGLVDESFSLNYMAKIPEDIDQGWYMFFVTLYLQIYWVVGAGLGNVLGGLLPFDLKGIEFAMTALFLVIFAENWMKEKFHESSLLGFTIALLCLIFVGKTHFLIPALMGIWLILTLRQVKLAHKLERLE